MELISITDSFDDGEVRIPVEYIFRLESGEEWVLYFVPTVQYADEDDDEEIFGDLFDFRVGEFTSVTRPIVRGGRREREILDRLGKWVDRTIPPDLQHSLLYGRFPKMSQEIVWHRELIWFCRALERRRARVEVG